MTKMVNTTTTGSNIVIVGTMGTEALTALWDLRWMLILIVVLILADFWFGISDAMHKHEEFRYSRAGRRTCNKLVDYITYLLIGSIMGLAIFEPLGWCEHTTTAAIGLGFGCVWEIDSIVGHVCSLHGMTYTFSIKRFILSLIKRKNKDVGEALEDALDGEDVNGKAK